MTEETPNPDQRQLINGTEGLFLVDAGPGTGKTFAITRRYGKIVDQSGIEPEDVLLVTFTRSAATEMTERIVDRSQYGLRELADAPIHTFHAHCNELLREHGYDVPQYLGLDAHITDSTQVLGDDLLEAERFREFFGGFRDAHPEYTDFYRILDEPRELLELLTQLAAKGIFPTADGWYRDGRSQLEGQFETFKSQFDAVNQPRNDGRKQSELRDKLGRYGRNKTYLPHAPAKGDVRGPRGSKQIPDSVATDVFDSDRDELIAFVHDLYHAYLEFALRRNYLTFGLLQGFAFVLLCENSRVRELAEFEYVMIDEFQDTSEIQFKIALLLAGADNFCVVGDWKQSIYAFQYADVQNLLDFKSRLERFQADLNRDGDRVEIETDNLTRIELSRNYRSTQSIIDLSEAAIRTPAESDETVSTTLEEVVELTPVTNVDNTVIEGVISDDEHEAVLDQIQSIVGNEEYVIKADGEHRTPTFDDIAVFTRTRDYGRNLLNLADEYEIPMAYDGGIELFRTDPAKLLLAWLRILDAEANRGWAVVLERAGYTPDEIEDILESASYPTAMASFREDLRDCETLGALTRQVLDRYGYTGDTGDVLLETIQSIYESTTVTRGDVIKLIERGIDTGHTVDVQGSAGEDAVTVQTIHAAKGLEYPIVIMANMNDGRFPPQTQETNVIQFHESVGLRQRKQYATAEAYPHVYDNWRYDVIKRCLSDNSAEERRLLYVAITRAERHVIFAGGETPNTFLEELPVEVRTVEPRVEQLDPGEPEVAELPFAVSTPDGPIGETPHDLMDETVFEDTGEQMEASPSTPASASGIDFGTRIHDFAEAYALTGEVSPTHPHETRVAAFIDSLPGTLQVEQPVTLPIETDGRQITLSGIVDLVHITDNRVEIIDYKTDSTRRAEAEYRKQLSVYYHVVADAYPERSVTASLFYTTDGERTEISPLSIATLRDLVQTPPK